MKIRWLPVMLALALAAAAFAAFPAPRALAAGVIYYSQGSLAPNLTSSWNTVRGGGGSAPANFTGGDIFVIQNGHNMTTTAVWSVSGTGSKLWIENGGTLTATSAVTLAAATTFQIDAGGTYVHNNTTAYGSTIFQGIEVFDAASTVILNNSNTTGPSSVTFGNLTVNFTSDPGGSVNCSGGLTTINGNLTIQSTSTREFRFVANNPATPTITIAGNVSISGGILNLTNGSATPTMNIGGNFSQTGGTFTSSGGGISTIIFTGGTPAVTFTTSGGTFTNDKINWQIASGKTVANNTNFGGGSWVNASRTMTVNGAFQINQGSWTGSSGTWSYGSGATLIFNNTSGSYGSIDGTHVYWPASNGPTNVNVQGAGGITLGVARTVAGLFQTAAGVTNGNHLTLNGTTQINTGGYFDTNSPVYGSSSTLVYNPGGSYNIGAEWKTGGTVGSGVPQNVTIQNGTAVALPNGAGSRTVAGVLTIGSGSSLSLGNNIGDDLNVGGNWVNNGTFNANNRAVTFTGTTTVSGSSTTSFAYVTITGALTGHSASMNVANDWTNNGAFSHNNGAVHFNGAGTQTIGGSAISSFFDVFLEPASVVIVPASNQPTVEGTLTNSGTLRQTKSVNAATVDFLNIKNGATTTDKYFGVQVATTNNLGSTTVSVSGNQICSQAQGYPVKRCFDVAPATAASADIKFYYSQAEMQTGQTSSSLNVWNYHSGTWNAVTRGGDSGSCNSGAINCYVQGDGISTYSPFALKNSSPLAVTLAEFSAAQVANHVLVTWETVSELNNRGFNLHRGVSPAGPDRQLNAALIPAQSQGSPNGFVYTWEDAADLVPGTDYFYWLDDVDMDSAVTRHGPVSVAFDGPTAVTLGRVSANPAAHAAALPWLWAAVAAGAALGVGRLRRR